MLQLNIAFARWRLKPCSDMTSRANALLRYELTWLSGAGTVPINASRSLGNERTSHQLERGG